MKPEEQRIAIAEACGWTQVIAKYGPLKPKEFRVDDEGIAWTSLETQMPDYPADLNAMHEAEKILNTNQAADYCELLRPIICGCWRLVHATAAQRAEAFLRTLNLWTES